MSIATMTDENVLPETAPRVYHARSLPERDLTDRLVPYRNIGALLTERTAANPDKNFLTFYEADGTSVPDATRTYAQFHEQAARVAAHLLQDLGLTTGDRIATLMTNDPRQVLLYFGAWLAGVTVVPINAGEDEDRIAFVLENAQVKVVFVAPKQAHRLQAHAGLRIIDVADVSIMADAPLAPLPDLPSDTEALIVYTSGTTGAPKGVVLEQYNLLVDAQGIAAWHGFTAEDRAMLVLPLHHVNGTVVTLMTPLYSGGSLVLNRKFSARNFWRVLAAEKCTWTSVVPTILAFLCEHGSDALNSLDLSQFRHFICGAGPLTTDLAARFDRIFGKRVVHGYGLSETTCYSCFLPIDLSQNTYHHWMTECGFPSIGIPLPANEMAIHDEQGTPLPPEARGEIVIRGHTVMRCYYRRPDANASTFAHGWFRSGDEGFYRVGPDGRPYFFITGRLKELIIRGGVNYSPFDIDEALNAIPGVRAAMAVGFENNFYGEEIGAYVQLEPDATLTPDEILTTCAQTLPWAKCPKVVVFGEDFPVTSTGKYQRNRLRDRFAAWRDAVFSPPAPSGGALSAGTSVPLDRVDSAIAPQSQNHTGCNGTLPPARSAPPEGAGGEKSLFTEQRYDRYTEADQRAWQRLFARQRASWERFANPYFQKGLECLCLDPERIPRLDAVNQFLAPRTGFQARAVPGYIPAFQFFECLRNRVFPTTITIRDAERLDYLPEPDIFHDIAGHVPMHTDTAFADALVRFGDCAHTAAEIVGGISDEAERLHRLSSILRALARFFWFTVEFGLMQGEETGGEIKVYGSGLLSSHGEIEHSILSPDVQRYPIQLEWVINQGFEIDHYQPLLFIVKSFGHLYELVGELEMWMREGRLNNVAPGEPIVSETDLQSFLKK